MLGAMQAFILMIGLNINEPFRGKAKKIASILLLNVILMMGYYLVLLNRIELVYPHIDSLGSAAWMGFFPLYYFLCESLTKSKFQFKRTHWVLMIVPLLFIIEEVVGVFVNNFNSYYLVNEPGIYLDLWMFIFFSTGIFCLVKTLKSLQCVNYSKNVRELNFFTYAYLSVLIFFGLTYLILRKNYTWTFELILLGLIEVFVFVILYRVFKFSSAKNVLGIKAYPNSIHVEFDYEDLAEKIEQVMKEKQPYLDKKLTLAKLSELSDISTNKLSQVFSIHYQSSFYQFVNSYRINHLQLLLENSQYEKFTISAMAEMSGFNSKATFYKVFKEKHGVSPSEYLNKISV